MTDKPKRKTPFSKGGSHYKPPSGIPARGEGWGGGAGKPKRAAFDAERQPTPEAKAAGHAESRTARAVAQEHAGDMAALLLEIARDPSTPAPTRVDAANKLIERAEGKPAQAIGGDPNGVPLKTVVTWEDEGDA